MASEKLIADLWDVGQGDATTIRLPDGSLVIIDVGPRGSPVIDWLADHHFKIHAVVLTHNDGDHAGCLPSLVKQPGISISSIYMLQDRDKHSPSFRRIWLPVREEERKGRFTVLGLARDTVIWQGQESSLKVVYPSFSENIEARRPNESSAIVCLYYRELARIIWSGDAPMQALSSTCADAAPLLLHGPHHGGPVDRNKAEFRSWVARIEAERVFVSVGTKNQHNLPSGDYLQLQRDRGSQVICTQLTPLCDRSRVNSRQPVMQTAALLGLRPPRRGIPCRGCLRLTIEGDSILADPWDEEHLRRIKLLRRPQCVRRD